MKQAVVGLLAHVDAGKTTLAEAMLLAAGAIRTAGRVPGWPLEQISPEN